MNALLPQQQPFLPLTPEREQGPSPHCVSAFSAHGSCCPSGLQSRLHVLVATPYRRASSVHICFCEFNSLMPRHELVEPRYSHTPPQHSAANIKTQQRKSSLPRACGILSKTRESPSCAMGTWSMPSNKVMSPARPKHSAQQKRRLDNLLGPFHLFSRMLHRERESLGIRKCSCKENTTFAVFPTPAFH